MSANRPEWRLTLPYPPSVNHYWRQFQGRMILSRAGRQYRDRLRYLWPRAPIPGAVEVDLVAFAPDGRRRDLDNLLKAVNDALTYGGVIEDDSMIRRQSQTWGGIDRRDPRVEIRIQPYPESKP